MLTDEEKSKIKAEEIYRREIRDELNRDKKKSARVWAFFNSAIFLWFLTTVAVGSLTYVWTAHQNRLANERAHSQKQAEDLRARADKINKLDLEIEGRFSHFIVEIEPMVRKPPDEDLSLAEPFTINDIRQRWDQMKLAPRNNPAASLVYPEFSDRGLISLVVELLKLEEHPDGRQRDDWQSAGGSEVLTVEAKQLQQIAVDLQDNIIFDDKPPGRFLPLYKEFYNRFMLKRWRKIFPYMDCFPPVPFC